MTSTLTFKRITNYLFRFKGTRLTRHGTYCTQAKENKILKHLITRIKATGPLPVSDYMQEILTSPIEGYYMTRDVFGQEGDFITSPEISQMFGEMIGIWFLSEWSKTEKSPIQLVELGPGRGTLVDDILRAFKNFDEVKGKVSVHMVEISPVLAQIQIEKLTGRKLTEEQLSEFNKSYESPGTDKEYKPYYTCTTKYGQTAYWHKSLVEVPVKHSFFIAHEFFDALPICKFQKTPDKGWCEVMVDINPDKDSPNQFRFVLSPGATPNSTGYMRLISPKDPREHVEIAPISAMILLEIAERIKQNGGLALIADYGHKGNKTDTLRGFKNHKLHDVLCDPGTADITADVDFSLFRNLCLSRNDISPYGPITQREFLQNMGIYLRLHMLLRKETDEKKKKHLQSGYEMMTNPDKMGERFKFFAILPKQEKQYIPDGFKPLPLK